jgi:hypothetical protein
MLIFQFLIPTAVFGVHDSMNFVLKPMLRECFYEDFDSNSPVRTIDAFVQAGGNVAVLLTIHGPLELSEIRSVSDESNYSIPDQITSISHINCICIILLSTNFLLS